MACADLEVASDCSDDFGHYHWILETSAWAVMSGAATWEAYCYCAHATNISQRILNGLEAYRDIDSPRDELLQILVLTCHGDLLQFWMYPNKRVGQLAIKVAEATNAPRWSFRLRRGNTYLRARSTLSRYRIQSGTALVMVPY